MTSVKAIHNRILKDKLKQLVDEVKAHTPQIQREKMMHDFLTSINTFSLKERLILIWRILRKKV